MEAINFASGFIKTRGPCSGVSWTTLWPDEVEQGKLSFRLDVL